jgi:hypothetical protein
MEVPPGDRTIDTPGAAELNQDLIEVWRAADNSIWYNFFRPGGTTIPQPIPNNATTPSAPAIIVYNQRTYVLHRGTDNKIYASQPTIGRNASEDVWTPWTAIPNNVTTVATPVVAVFNGLLTVVYTGENSQLWKITSADGKTWSNATVIQGNAITTSSAAIATALDTPLHPVNC